MRQLLRPDQLDAATLLATCGGDPLLLHKLIDSFQQTVHGHVANLHNAAGQGDAERFQKAAHKLRGLISAFSPRIATTLASLEQIVAVEQQADFLLAECDKVRDAIAILTEALAGLSIEDLKSQIR